MQTCKVGYPFGMAVAALLLMLSSRVVFGQPEAPQIALVKMQFVDAKSGWALGYAADALHLYRTNDAGLSWKTVTPKDFFSRRDTDAVVDKACYDVGYSFLSPLNGWVAFETLGGRSASIIVRRTTDGGSSWENCAIVPITVDFEGGDVLLQFMDAAHGTLLVSSDTAMGHTQKVIYSTADGGLHWVARHSKNIPGVLATDVFFSNRSNGWITTPYREDATKTPVFRTTDSGDSWRHVQLRIPTDLMGAEVSYINAYGPTFSKTYPKIGTLILEFRDNATGLSTFVLYRTTDSGEHWRPTSGRFQAPSPGGELSYFSDGSKNAWFIDEKGRLYVSHNSGKAWIQIMHSAELTGDTTETYLQFPTANEGFALRVGAFQNGQPYSSLFRTKNGGRTWALIQSNQ